MIKIPPYLKKGDTIGITCPAGYMPKAKAQTCIETLQQWGFQVMVGKTLGSASANYFSGPDEQRLYELQAMLDDPSIRAILFGRGGYGLGRIIDQLDFRAFKKNPKWLIGFSDITVIHCHLIGRIKTASLHAPMAAAFNDGGAGDVYIRSLHKALTGKKQAYSCKPNAFNHKGNARGILVGGNLSLLTHLIETPSALNTKNNILFIEDIGELLYNIDRMMYQLKRSGYLDHLQGLIIGGFTEMKDTERPFGKSVSELIHDLVKDLGCPICFDFPVSHGKENFALKIGVEYELNVGSRLVRLKEL